MTPHVAELALTEQVGERLFGRPGRLRLMLWLIEQPVESELSQAEAARALGLRSRDVGEDLERLQALGMVSEPSRVARNREKRFMRLEHPMWRALSTVRDALTTGW